MGNFKAIQMRNRVFILLLTYSLISCNSQAGKSSKVITAKDSTFLTVERFFPETKEIEKVDTVIADRQLQITITRANLDSYVKNEYEDEGKKLIDKYRDYEVVLMIKQGPKILLDTVLKKEQFGNYADKEFMNIAVFQNYWFKKLDKDKIEIFGSICKPDTDDAFDFHHYYDLTNRKLTLVQLPDEE
jgi:hypothetical protein